MEQFKRTVIVGGGAAGFFAAINVKALDAKREVIIVEKTQKLLSKVRVSGGGRCNVTHACFDPSELVDFYPRGKKELQGPFHYFSTADTISWFADRGIDLKVEDDGRMFPTTDDSESIINCFLSEAERLGVIIKKACALEKAEKGEHWKLFFSSGEVIDCDSLIMACGGNPKLNHYKMVEQLGHKIVPPIPSLFSFNLKKERLIELLGIAVDVTVKIPETGSEEYGPLLITHWGVSGPAVLKLSSKEAKYLHRKNYSFQFNIEWLPNAGAWLVEKRSSAGGKLLVNSNSTGIPKRLWFYLLERANLSGPIKVADLSREQMETFVQTFENDTYQAKGKTTFKEEFVTCGGVDLKEVNFKTMESKIIDNLYFAGEYLNIDALTGGFNFQAAWTTAWLAAKGISAQ